MDTAQIKKILFESIERKRGEIVKTLADLVRIPSVTGTEGEAQKHVQKLYADLGLKVVVFDPDLNELMQHPAFSKRQNNPGYKGRPDVLGILEGKKGERSLKLNAHIDTVPVEPISAWTTPPWTPRVEGNLMYGRGAQDDKQGIVANYFGLKTVLDTGLKPRGTVMLESVVEEEGGGAGSLASLMKGYVTDGIVFMDSGPAVICGTVGGVWLHLKVTGRTMHAGWADLGVNAILKMNKLIDAITEVGEKRTREVHVPLFESAGRKVTVIHNIGTFRGGTGPGVVPAEAEIDVRFGVAPGEKPEDVRSQVEVVIRAAAAKDEWLKDHPPEIVWAGTGYTGWLQDVEHPFVKTYQKSAESAAGRPFVLSAMTAAADARFAPYFNVPALMCGASGNSHSIDEFVDLNSVIEITKVVAAFIVDWCGVDEVARR